MDVNVIGYKEEAKALGTDHYFPTGGFPFW